MAAIITVRVKKWFEKERQREALEYPSYGK